MSRLAIIPARGGSKRIPDKNIVDFLGAPLMSYPIRAAQRSELFDAVHVSTDSERIAGVAADFGCPVDFMRAPDLADDYTPLIPVLKSTLDRYGAMGRTFRSVCMLMPTAPLIDADDLVKANALFQQNDEIRTVIAVARYSVPIEWAFRMKSDGTLVPCEPGKAGVRSQDLQPAYFDSGTFIFFPAGDIEVDRVNEAGMIAYVLPRHKAVDIDDADDLELAKIIARGIGKRDDG